MADDKTLQRVKTPYDLPTCQKRIRHLRSLAVRNLMCKSYKGRDVMKMETYFTLHAQEKSPAFYTSEKIKGSMNPTWQSFDMSRHENSIDTTKTSLCLRIWTGHEDRFKVMISINLDVRGLVFLTEKLQQSSIKFPPNSVIFGMFDKFFIGCDDVALLRKTGHHSPENVSLAGPKVLQVDEPVLRVSYTTSGLNRIQTVLRAIKQTQAQVQRKQEAIEDHWRVNHRQTQKMTERETRVMRVGQLREEAAWQTGRVQSEKDQYEKVQADTRRKRETQKERKGSMVKEWVFHRDAKQTHVQTREKLLKANAHLRMRQKQLICDLAQYIYPIKQVGKDYLILNVRLPNADVFQGHDDSMVGTALGYAAHMVSMLGHFLDLPLRFPIEHRGSRSMIYDLVHHKLSDKDRAFPLYPRGNKERFKFDYGVFLLNQDICQLRLYCGLPTPRLVEILPNIKSMLELRLGVKMEGTAASEVSAANAGTASGNGSLVDSAQSVAGSSSMSSFLRKEQVLVEPLPEPPASDSPPDTTSQPPPASDSPPDTASQPPPASDSPPDTASQGPAATDTPKPAKAQHEDEAETLFEGSDDSFFKIRRQQSPAFVIGSESSGTDDQQKSDAGRSLSSREPTPSDQEGDREHLRVDYSCDSNHLEGEGSSPPHPSDNGHFGRSPRDWTEADALLTMEGQETRKASGDSSRSGSADPQCNMLSEAPCTSSVNGDPHIPDAAIS